MEDQFFEQLNSFEAADVTMRTVTTKQKVVVAAAMFGVAAVAAAATPQGRQAIFSATTKARIKLARLLVPKACEVVSKTEF